MHYAWRIAREGLDPAAVPERAGIDICWVHRNRDGTPDLAASQRAAEQMVRRYGMAHRAALESRHTERRAIDMTITWRRELHITDANGNVIGINTLPRTGAGNADLHGVGASYGVHKLLGDPPHWSDDGH